jgi:hypothetical protein
MNSYKVVAYYGGIPPGNKNPEKPLILDNFIQGVNLSGDQGVAHKGTDLIEADVALIQGFIHELGKTSPHLLLRWNAINLQKRSGKKSIFVDSNLFLYATPGNVKHYLRYSFDGVFPTTGIYCDTTVDPSRWRKISRDLNVTLKDYRTSGDHILICLQRNGGWSMGGVDIQDWAIQVINTIRQYSDRPIVIRPHPGDRASRDSIRPGNPNCRIKFSKHIRLSNNPSLVDDLKNCWAAINYNSSPVVGAAIEGIPIFVSDPVKSQCSEIANTDLTQIENPRLPDRQQWAERLSMFHWNFDELRSGECWAHMRKFINL